MSSIVVVVTNRRSRAPWGMALRYYVILALVIVVMRLGFAVLLGGTPGGTRLFRLPEVTLPAWAAGIRLGGTVTLETLQASLYGGLSIAAMIFCLGGANALANPRRALRNVPGALYEVSVSIVIALATAPQLIETAQRVRRAQRLRGAAPKGLRGLVNTVVPVFEDSIERSIQLAASMESRGFGATRNARRVPRATTATLLAAMLAVVFGCFALLLGQFPPLVPVVAIGVGVVLAVVGVRWSGHRLAVTRYRPDRWAAPDWATIGAGLAAAAVAVWLARTQPSAMSGLSVPAAWPSLPLGALAIPALLIVPGFATPPPSEDER